MSVVELLHAIRSIAIPTVFRVVIDGNEYVLNNPRYTFVYENGLLKEIRVSDGNITLYRVFEYSNGMLVGISEWRVLQ